jgi:putative Ig domain-containing protein
MGGSRTGLGVPAGKQGGEGRRKPNGYARTKSSRAQGENLEPKNCGVGMRRAGFAAAILLVCMGAVLIAGCGGGGAISTISIEIIPPAFGTSVDVGSPQVLTFHADVGGDSSNKGVSWTLTGSSSNCSGSGCGTLANQTQTSVDYTAPTALPSGATSTALNVTLTAFANAQPTVTKTVTITVQPAPTFSTTSCNPPVPPNPCILPNGANGVAYTQAIQITGGVAPYTFSFTSGGLPDCLSMNLGPTNVASTTILGKPCNPAASPGAVPVSFPFTIQVKDTGGAAAASQPYQITVNPPPPLSITTTSLPTATLKVVYNPTIARTGGVAPLSWSIVPGSGGLPPSMSLSPVSGVISGTPGLLDLAGSTCTPAVAGTYCFTVQAQDSALPTSQTKTQALTITIQPPPPLSITTVPGALADGATATPYVASLQGTGGIPPYTWTITQGQLPAGLTLATLNDGTGSISGTPVIATPPATPDAFTVVLTDSLGTTTAPATFTIKIAAGANNDVLLNGSYVFLFNGFDTGGAVYILGGITFDGKGNVSGGTEAINRNSGVVPPPSAPTLSGTYSVGSDGRGTMEVTATFSAGTGFSSVTADYSLAIQSDGTVRFFQYHPKTPPTNADTSTIGTGTMKPVQGSGFTNSSFSGNYALGFAGQDVAGKAAAMVGVIHANGSSQTLTPGTCDFNYIGAIGGCGALSGNFAVPTSGLPGAALSFLLPSGKQVNLTFAFFFVSPSDLFFVETDADKTTGKPTNFRLSGEMLLQQPNVKFGPQSLSGTSVLTGAGVGSGSSSVMVGVLSSPLCDGATANTNLKHDENNAGTVSTLLAFTGTCSIPAIGSNGRAAFTNLGATPAATRVAVAYLTGPNQGFFLGSDAAVTAGLLEQQTPGLAFSNATVYGSYALGTPFFGESKLSAIAGSATADGAGNLAGTLDVNGLAAASGNFTATNSAPDSTGRGTMITAPALSGFPTDLIYYVVTPGNLRAISADSGDAHPQTIFFDH